MITGALMADIAFEATEDSFHGWVPTCLASWLTVSSNLAASLAVPHVKYTSSSPDVGAVNFLAVAAPDPPDPAAFSCLDRLAFYSHDLVKLLFTN